MSLPSRVLSAALLWAAVAAAGAAPASAAENGPIAFSRGGALLSVAAGGGATDALSQPRYDHEPAYSPDGRRIAFIVNRDLWIMRADGTGRRALTTDAAFASHPTWSPDGRRIAYTAVGAGGRGDLFVIPAAGGEPQPVTSTPDKDERDAAWSPDGRRIAYTRVGCEGGGGSCVYVMDADGGNQVNLTPEDLLPGCESQPGYHFDGSSRDPAWSPDSRRIVFSGPLRCEVSAIGTDIWVMDASGGGKTDLTADDRTNEGEPVFSPDGSRIAFIRATSAGGVPHVFTMAASGGDLRQVTDGDLADSDPTWGVAARCVVPRLDGRTRAAAKAALKAAGCRLGRVTRRGGGRRVRSQSPRAGRSLPAGSKVSVVLGRGQAA